MQDGGRLYESHAHSPADSRVRLAFRFCCWDSRDHRAVRPRMNLGRRAESQMKAKRKSSAKKLPGVRQIRRGAGIKEPKSAIVLLKADHREVEAFFKAYKRSGSESEKQTLAKKICNALKVHARIEEDIFY